MDGGQFKEGFTEKPFAVIEIPLFLRWLPKRGENRAEEKDRNGEEVRGSGEVMYWSCHRREPFRMIGIAVPPAGACGPFRAGSVPSGFSFRIPAIA